MGMSLGDDSFQSHGVEMGPAGWPEHLEYLEIAGVPAGLSAAPTRARFTCSMVRRGGENVATGLSYDHDGDCGVFNVSTLERVRRRGLGTALTAQLVHDAVGRGCTTATLQSTPMAERVYAAVGFRDLGRILEFVPNLP